MRAFFATALVVLFANTFTMANPLVKRQEGQPCGFPEALAQPMKDSFAVVPLAKLSALRLRFVSF
ncbi:hypothetical protein K435DRAFT_777229, partial [Dendrothele bispora CBS 962.96]